MRTTAQTEPVQRIGYLRVPHVLLTAPRYRQLTSDAKLLYCLLQERQRMSARNGWIDEAGRIFLYFSVEEVGEHIGCGRQKALSLFRQLMTAGLVERKRPSKGRSCRIYVQPLPEESGDSAGESGRFSAAATDENVNSDRMKFKKSSDRKSSPNNIYEKENTWKKQCVERMLLVRIGRNRRPSPTLVSPAHPRPPAPAAADARWDKKDSHVLPPPQKPGYLRGQAPLEGRLRARRMHGRFAGNRGRFRAAIKAAPTGPPPILS